jgi:hypothetical protein
MRVPTTETDAFRITVALAIVAGLSVAVGFLASRAYGVVLFASGLTAGIVFELGGRDESETPLADAAHAPHTRATGDVTRHVLVLALETLGGGELARVLAAAGGDIRLDVLAPVLASRSQQLTGDVDRERGDAQARLDESLVWAREHGFAARGEVGDADAMVAIEDELRDFGADEVVIVMNVEERSSWLARRMIRHLDRELDVPVREVVLGEEEKSPDAPATGV